MGGGGVAQYLNGRLSISSPETCSAHPLVTGLRCDPTSQSKYGREIPPKSRCLSPKSVVFLQFYVPPLPTGIKYVVIHSLDTV